MIRSVPRKEAIGLLAKGSGKAIPFNILLALLLAIDLVTIMCLIY